MGFDGRSPVFDDQELDHSRRSPQLRKPSQCLVAPCDRHEAFCEPWCLICGFAAPTLVACDTCAMGDCVPRQTNDLSRIVPSVLLLQEVF